MPSAVSDGTTSVASRTHEAGMNLSTWTWAGWVKRTGLGEGDFRLVNKASTSNAGPLQVTGQSGGGALRGRQTRATTTSVAISLGDVMPSDTWVCLFVIFNGADTQGIRLYSYNGTNAVAEMSYSSITNGSGATSFNTEALRFFNTTDGTLTYQGKAAHWVITPDIWSNATMLGFAQGTLPVGLYDHYWSMQSDLNDSGEVGGWHMTGSNVTFDGADSPPVSYGGGITIDRTVTDASGLTDAPIAISLTKALTDTSGLTDSSISIGPTKALTESAGLTDAATTIVSGSRTATDTSGLTDVVTAVIGTDKVTVDGAGLTDSLSTTAQTGKTQTDTSALSDTATTALTMSTTLTDTLGLTDIDDDYSLDIVVEVDEPVGLTDNASTTKAIDRSVTESLGVLDTLIQAAQVDRTLAESLGVLDAATGDSEQVTDAIVSDLLGLTDASAVVKSVDRSIVDTSGLLDEATTSAQVIRSVDEPLGMLDGVSAELEAAMNQSVDDSLGLTDTTISTQNLIRETTDAVGISDSSTSAALVPKTQDDGLGLLDSVSAQIFEEQTVTDPEQLSDAVAAQLSRNQSVTDNESLVDSVAVHLTIVLDDSLGLLDEHVTEVSGQVSVNTTDPLSISDSVSTTATKLVTITDGMSLVDSRVLLRSLTLNDDLSSVDDVDTNDFLTEDVTDEMTMQDTVFAVVTTDSGAGGYTARLARRRWSAQIKNRDWEARIAL